MTLDLVVLGLVLLFAVLGLFSGAARQIARLAGMAAAYVAAGPAGRFVSLPIAQRLGTSLTIGTVIGTLACFFFIYIVVNVMLTAVLKRLFEGKDSARSGMNRMLGFALGGFKAATVLYLSLCAASFLESNVTIAGRQLRFTPRDSELMKLVHHFNVLELQQFGGLHELVKAAKVAGDPHSAAKLKDDPDLAALQKDPRFRALLGSEALRKALESGDEQGLLSNNSIVELIQDPKFLHRLEHVAERGGDVDSGP